MKKLLSVLALSLGSISCRESQARSLSATETTYDVVVKGKECSSSENQVNCTYRVGRDLAFSIPGVGQADAVVTVEHANFDGDFYVSVGGLHGCAIVKPGKLRSVNSKEEPIWDIALVSLKNGRVYREWRDCQNAT